MVLTYPLHRIQIRMPGPVAGRRPGPVSRHLSPAAGRGNRSSRRGPFRLQRCRQPDLRQQGNESGPAASLVSYHGFLSSAEKEAFLRRGDCFVFPSHWESFGLVLLEAMAYGLPIVAARCAGSSEVMPPGYPQMVDLRSPCEIASAIHGLFCVDSFEFLRGYFEGSFSAARYVTKLGAAIQKHC